MRPRVAALFPSKQTMPLVLIALSIQLLAPIAGAGAGTATLIPIFDNTIYEESGSLSNGQGQYVFAGRTAGGAARRALFLFDPAMSLPAGAKIVTAHLELELSLTNAPVTSVSLHRATAPWGEGGSNALGEEGAGAPAVGADATWQFRYFVNSTSWANPGGDFDPTPSAATSVGGNGVYTFGSTAAMVADVQSWIDTPSSMAGWILIGDESTGSTAKRFNSRHTPTGIAPKLVITFDPPGPGQSLCTPGEAGVSTCPCANPPSAPSRGCDNSSGSGGARLVGTGSASVAADTVVLTTTGELPTALSIVFQGNALVAGGAPFGEGVRCAGGMILRLWMENAVGGGFVYPDGGEPRVAARSATLGDPIAPGSTRWYQVYYRDPALPCAGEPNFNATQALAIQWNP